MGGSSSGAGATSRPTARSASGPTSTIAIGADKISDAKNDGRHGAGEILPRLQSTTPQRETEVRTMRSGMDETTQAIRQDDGRDGRARDADGNQAREDDPLKEVTSRRIKALRLAKRWNREDVARETGVARQTYSTWEDGEAEPQATKIRKLSRLFGVSTEWILGLDEGPLPMIPMATYIRPGPVGDDGVVVWYVAEAPRGPWNAVFQTIGPHPCDLLPALEGREQFLGDNRGA
jgi:transcriptional regulator with XRE-family HTH domain